MKSKGLRVVATCMRVCQINGQKPKKVFVSCWPNQTIFFVNKHSGSYGMAIYDLMHRDSGTYDITRHCKQGYNSVIFQNKSRVLHYVFIYLLTPKSSQDIAKEIRSKCLLPKAQGIAKVLTSLKQDDDDLVS